MIRVRLLQGSQRGVTLLEVSLAVMVLATAIMGVIGTFVTSERIKVLAREENIALYAAEEAINQIRAQPFSTSFIGVKIVADFDGETRPVNLDGPNATKQRLSMGTLPARIRTGGDGLKVSDELGIFIINQESPNEGMFGDAKEDADNDGVWENPDGDIDFPIDLNHNGSFLDTLSATGTGHVFPMDLGGTSINDTSDPGYAASIAETIPTSQLLMAPVVVVVRWQSMAGLERRIQVLTFVVDRSGRY